MRFRFRLEAILRLKENEEKEAKERLLKIRGEIAAVEADIARLERELDNSVRKRSFAIERGKLIDEALWRRYIPTLEARIKALRERLMLKKKEEEKALEVFLEKRRERKSLEKLRERRFREFLKEIDSQERRTIDEVAERQHWWKS